MALIAISITLFTSCEKDDVECRPVTKKDEYGNPYIRATNPNYYIYECQPEGCHCDTTLDIVEYDMMYGI
jgi:hypothetical protein